MQRRRFSREFNLEAIKLVRERGVPGARQACLPATGLARHGVSGAICWRTAPIAVCIVSNDAASPAASAEGRRLSPDRDHAIEHSGPAVRSGTTELKVDLRLHLHLDRRGLALCVGRR
jgi:hypothetical protein